MNKDIKHFTIRVSNILLDKISYIAKHEGRTKNKELEYMIVKHIENFEQKIEKINVNDL